MTKIAVTIPEAVQMIGVGRSTLYGLMKDGKLTARKHGSRTLLLVDELDAFVRSLPTSRGV